MQAYSQPQFGGQGNCGRTKNNVFWGQAAAYVTVHIVKWQLLKWCLLDFWQTKQKLWDSCPTGPHAYVSALTSTLLRFMCDMLCELQLRRLRSFICSDVRTICFQVKNCMKTKHATNSLCQKKYIKNVITYYSNLTILSINYMFYSNTIHVCHSLGFWMTISM